MVIYPQGAIVHSFDDAKASPAIKASQALQEKVTSHSGEVGKSKLNGGAKPSSLMEGVVDSSVTHGGMTEVALEKDIATEELPRLEGQETIPGHLVAAPVELRASKSCPKYSYFP